MVQTSYSMEQTPAVNGLPADAAGGPRKVGTYNNPAVEIPFGRAVAKVTGDEDGAKLPDGAGVELLGVALRDPTVELESSTAENAYAIESAVAVMRRGRVYVQVEETVTPDDAVYVRHTANGPLTKLGAFRNDADGGNAILFSGAKFVKGAATDGYAILDVNLP